ncbi:MAG TPA: acetyl-coenzyme A synthetase N-terminal domain-containing protein, partial [Sulfurovum sp.]|nr:acetyl-coenzyme A synthetase N-terminal domain-containing protein [Sulfurovum sp.]
MLQELYQPNAEFSKDARIKSMDEYHALVKKATDDYEGFWKEYADEKIDWFEPYNTVLDESNAPFVKWFDGGKLNVAYQCIDRHLETQKNKAAIIFEGDRGDKQVITYLDLFYNVNKFANLL